MEVMEASRKRRAQGPEDYIGITRGEVPLRKYKADCEEYPYCTHYKGNTTLTAPAATITPAVYAAVPVLVVVIIVGI